VEPHRTRNLAGCSEPGTSEPTREGAGRRAGTEPGTSEPRNLVWRPNFSKRASGALKIFSYDLDLEPGPKNLEPGTSATGATNRGTWNLEPGMWNLEPETWNLPPKKSKKIAPAAQAEPGTSEPGTSTCSRGTLGTGTSEPCHP